jgi:DNA-directed RNA polymerase specialized sigma24 family protein
LSRVKKDWRAIDKLVRNPNMTGDAFRIARNALSDARKILARRHQLLPLSALEEADVRLPGDDKVIELTDWLERTSDLNADERSLLERLAEGATADDIARELDLPVTVVRVRISRARARARRAWAAA